MSDETFTIDLQPLNDDITNLNLQTFANDSIQLDMTSYITPAGNRTGISDELKVALLNCFAHVAWIDDDGQDYYDALESALYPPADLVSISAVYTQSGTVYDTGTLDSLKPDLVVTAVYSDSTTETVTTYTLSGTLEEGPSTITVSYGGKTTTFNVTVTETPAPTPTYLYNWDFTQSLRDSANNRDAVLSSGESAYDPTRDSNGLHFTEATQTAYLGQISLAGKTIEIDVSSFDFAGSTSNHIRFLMNNSGTGSSGVYGNGSIIWRKDNGWASYGYSVANAQPSSNRIWGSVWGNLSGGSSAVLNAFSGKTVKVVFDSDGHTKSLYLDDVLIGTETAIYFDSGTSKHVWLGGIGTHSASAGDQCYNMIITGVRVYANE